MKLEIIIQQLDKKNYSMLVKKLKENKADKFISLLTGYRQKPENDQELLDKLDISPTAFYTLKSRLADKVQDFLYDNTDETRVQLLKNVANVEQLVYKTHRETAIGILKKLEKELIKMDMPNELIIVYRALKKLNIHNQKYYEYSQLYNKYVAFNLGQDKAEDLLCSFCKTQSEYYLNRNDQLLDILILYKRDLQNICKLYASHHLHVYKNILNIHFALFSPVKKEMEEDESVEQMLKETLSIIETHLDHRTYKHLVQVVDFLYFEYYLQLNLYKNAKVYYEKFEDNNQALLICSHSSFVSHFFISKIKYALIYQTENQLYSESDLLYFDANKEDKPSYVLYKLYVASTEFYSNLYSDGIKTLSKLLSEINLIDSPFLEIEIKLFLALLHILDGTTVQADNILRSASRKILEENNDTKYRAPIVFIKLLKVSLSPLTKNKHEKLVELNEQFIDVNSNKYPILEFLKLNGDVLNELVKLGNSKVSKKQ